MQDTLKLEADELDQRSTLGATPLNYEQETVASIWTGSPQSDDRRLKNLAWSDESRFLQYHSDGKVRIQAGSGVMVWGMIFSWHTYGPLVPNEQCINAKAFLSIVADHVHSFMTTYPSSNGYYFGAAPKLWNSLPLQMRQSDCICPFKNPTKTYPFRITLTD